MTVCRASCKTLASADATGRVPPDSPASHNICAVMGVAPRRDRVLQLALDSGYDVLHTQGERWLVSDLDEFLKIRGVSA